jgi:hypothetical protein
MSAKWDAAKEQAAFEKRKADWQTQVKKIDAENAKLPADKKKAKAPGTAPAGRSDQDAASSQRAVQRHGGTACALRHQGGHLVSG